MSAVNAETVRRWLAAMSSTSPEEAADAVEELWDVDADFYPVRKFAEARPCHGRKEMALFMRSYLDAYALSDWVLNDVRAVGDDRILACTRVRSEGLASGATLEGDLYLSVWLRHGRILRMENHLTLRGALDGLGLRGETLEAAGLLDQT